MKQSNSNDTCNEHNDSISSIADKNEEFNNILKSFQEEFKITNKLIYNIHNSFSQFNEKFNTLIDILQTVYNKNIKNFNSNNYDTNG
ncbi:MAG: hypothetical protein ACYCT7_08255, partial [bacterium]